MIISDLCDEYAVLVSQNKAPAYGYDNTNVPYGLVIDDDGTLVRVRPLGDFSGKKPVNIIPVPARFPRSSGIVANFLCDNVTYLLGCDTKGNAKRSAQAFQACGELHRRILDGVKDRAASAVCAFFSKAPQWQTAQRLMGDEAWKCESYLRIVHNHEKTSEIVRAACYSDNRNASDDPLSAGSFRKNGRVSDLLDPAGRPE